MTRYACDYTFKLSIRYREYFPRKFEAEWMDSLDLIDIKQNTNKQMSHDFGTINFVIAH